MALAGAAGGSGERLQYECGFCKVGEETKEAKHFCPLCQEYLCDVCHFNHKRSKVTMFHETIPVKGEQKQPGHVHITCDCGQNPDYYCEAHKEVFCVTCKIIEHRLCDVEVLGYAIKHKRNISQFKTTIDELRKLRVLAAETESLQNTLLESQDDNECTCEQSIRSFKNDFSNLLEQLERKAIDDLKRRSTVQKNQMTDHKAVCKNIKDKLDAGLIASTDILNANDPQAIFMQNIRLSQMLNAYRGEIKNARAETIS